MELIFKIKRHESTISAGAHCRDRHADGIAIRRTYFSTRTCSHSSALSTQLSKTITSIRFRKIQIFSKQCQNVIPSGMLRLKVKIKALIGWIVAFSQEPIICRHRQGRCHLGSFWFSALHTAALQNTISTGPISASLLFMSNSAPVCHGRRCCTGAI
jgi:hypothetical protein